MPHSRRVSTKPAKYQPLADYLAAQRADTVTLTFAEVEAILSVPLPVSAYSPTWWTNSPSMDHARRWIAVGWRRDQVHIAAEWVSFRRA